MNEKSEAPLSIPLVVILTQNGELEMSNKMVKLCTMLNTYDGLEETSGVPLSPVSKDSQEELISNNPLCFLCPREYTSSALRICSCVYILWRVGLQFKNNFFGKRLYCAITGWSSICNLMLLWEYLMTDICQVRYDGQSFFNSNHFELLFDWVLALLVD